MFNNAIRPAPPDTTDRKPLPHSRLAPPPAEPPAPGVQPGYLPTDQLYFQRCTWCKTPSFRCALCPACASPRLQWECSTGTGLIIHATIARRKLKKYVACRVTMDDGFQLRGRLIAAHPLSIAAGTRVRLDLSAAPVPTPFAFRPQQIPGNRL